MRTRIIILFLCIGNLKLYCQGELDTQDKIFYRNERTYAFLLNSNGFGFNFRYAKRIDAFRKTLYEVEFNHLKHPKEIKARLYTTNRNIVFGQLNSVYTLKGAIGYQKEFFQKRDLGSISIRYFTNGGLSLAMLKPVYFEYQDNVTGEPYYDKFQQHGNFIGKGPFVKGINEISMVPGLYGKIGLSFEYSKIDKIYHALEFGMAFDAYAKKVKIMDTPANKILYLLPDDQFFITLFVSYRFGKVIDTQFNPKHNAIDNMISN
jgi:hypothetical protein